METKKILRKIASGQNFIDPLDKLFDRVITGELKYSKSSIIKIADIQSSILESDKNDLKIFINTGYISPVLYPFFCSLIPVGNLYGKNIRMGYSASNNRLKSAFDKHGVFAHFTGNRNNSISVDGVQFTEVVADATTTDIVNKTVSLLPVKMSDKYKNKFTSKLYEVFINAQKHSKSDLPTMAIAFMNKTKFYFSAYDAGIGIPSNVRLFLQDEDLTDREAMEWALTDNNSTASNSSEVSRGAGLGVIEQFVKENRGVMMLVSGSCCYVVNGSTSSYIRLPNSVKGTFFSMKINVDREHLYE
ncbi:MAG: hypothetical protein J6B49_07875 [Phascolarctobacterium sp.]|nr:hypothetical protein [Phascolarctobacterium sp.]